MLILFSYISPKIKELIGCIFSNKRSPCIHHNRISQYYSLQCYSSRSFFWLNPINVDPTRDKRVGVDGGGGIPNKGRVGRGDGNTEIRGVGRSIPEVQVVGRGSERGFVPPEFALGGVADGNLFY